MSVFVLGGTRRFPPLDRIQKQPPFEFGSQIRSEQETRWFPLREQELMC